MKSPGQFSPRWRATGPGRYIGSVAIPKSVDDEDFPKSGYVWRLSMRTWLALCLRP